MTPKSIGKNLQNLRLAAGLTQREADKEMGFRDMKTFDYERGKNKLDVATAYKYCQLYNCDLNDLINPREIIFMKSKALTIIENIENRIDIMNRKRIKLCNESMGPLISVGDFRNILHKAQVYRNLMEKHRQIAEKIITQYE